MDHPLIQHKIGIIRREETGSKDFRMMIGEIAMLMCYEATRDLKLQDVEIQTPICKMTAKELAGKKLAVVPILRAGLGMVEGMLAMIPAAKVCPSGAFSCAWSSCVPPVLPVLRPFGAGVAAVDVPAALHLALCGMVAQPGKEQRQQQQHHRGDEVGVGDDTEGLDTACKAQGIQHPDGTAGHRQPVPDARFDPHASLLTELSHK